MKPDLLKILQHYGADVQEHRVTQLVRCVGPNHLDTKASLSVNLTKALVNCMACDLRGDVYRIVEIMEGLAHGAARERAAQIAGIPNEPLAAGGGRPSLSGSTRPARGGFRPKTRAGLRPASG